MAKTACPKCRTNDLLVVRLTPAEREMLFHTCRHCEHRWWTDVEEGARVPVSSVIEEIAG